MEQFWELVGGKKDDSVKEKVAKEDIKKYAQEKMAAKTRREYEKKPKRVIRPWFDTDDVKFKYRKKP